MKTILIFLSIFTGGIFELYSQNFNGQAIYSVKINMKNSFFIPNQSNEEKAIFLKKIANLFESEFTLHFNANESIFIENEKIEIKKSKNGETDVVKKTLLSEGNLYKNLKNKTYVQEADIYGKDFLIADYIKPLNWKIHAETKKIGNYICQKASAVEPVSNVELERYEQNLKKNKKLHLPDDFEKPRPINHVVWFTSQIPVSNGPGCYFGLPGLILEASDGKTTSLCNKIILNPKKKHCN